MNELSKIQSDRIKHGGEWEDKILSMSSSKWENCDLTLVDLETTKKWICDLVNHEDKIFLELTTSCKDGKEAKVIIESKVHKHHYPDYKFVMGVQKVSCKRLDGLNSHIDHLNQTSTIDQVLIGEEEILKFMNKPFYNKKITINNKPTGVVMTSSTLLMDTILHGASIGNKDAVTKLVEMMSTSKPKPPKSKPKGKLNQSSAKKRTYFMNNLDTSDLVSEPTQSIADVLENKMGQSRGDFERFMQSKEATSMMKNNVTMIEKNPNEKLSERYHLRVSDVEKYVS